MKISINIVVLFRMFMQRYFQHSKFFFLLIFFFIVIRKQNKLNANTTKNDDLNPYQLLKPLFTKKICSYRPENYWKYEICHGKYIRQFHEDPGIKVRQKNRRV